MPPFGIALEESRDRRIGPRRLHELDARIAELDVSETHPLLFVHLRRRSSSPYTVFRRAAAASEVRHDDRYMAQSPVIMTLSAVRFRSLSPREARRCGHRKLRACRAAPASVCCPERRRRAPHRGRRIAETKRNAEHPHFSRSRMLDACAPSRARSCAASSSACATELMRPHGMPAAPSLLDPGLRRRRAQDLRDGSIERVAVGNAIGIRA